MGSIVPASGARVHRRLYAAGAAPVHPAARIGPTPDAPGRGDQALRSLHPMTQALLPIARNAFVESLRQPVYLVMLLIAALLQVLNTWVTGFTMGYRNVPGEVTGDNKLLFDVSLATVFVCGMVLAAFIATSTISREIDNKTILTVVSKPIGRTTVILGKFLGVAGAMTLAVAVMMAMLLIAIRHGVLTTAADVVDQPVVVFGVGGFALALLLAGAGNFLYGWSFPQTASLLMLPLLWVGYLLILLISKKWAWQPIGADFKPQIMLACLCLGGALLVMTAIAVAASTRLGQVMTIAVCMIFFVLGLLSNYFVGRFVYSNDRVGQIANAWAMTAADLFDYHTDKTIPMAAQAAGVTPEEFVAQGYRVEDYLTARDVIRLGRLDDDPVWREVMFIEPGAVYRIDLLSPPRIPIKAGDPFYYGASPNGVGMAVPRYEPLTPDEFASGRPVQRPALVVDTVDDLILIVRQAGAQPVRVARPPLPRDSIFIAPTRVNPVAMAAWGLIPNMQSFWLVDAITQAQPIPLSHMVLVLVYGACQIVVFLSVAVLLFQGRDVG